MTNWENSTISFILQTGKWIKAKQQEDLLPESISLIRKLTGAYTTLQIIFEDEYTARIKNAMPLFLDDFILDPAPIKKFLEANNFEPVYWKNITEQNNLFTDILLALSSAVLIPVVSNSHYRLIIIGWSEPQSFNNTFQNFIAVIKTRLEELQQNARLYHILNKDNNRYSAIFHSIPQAIVFIDDEGETGWVNKSAATLLQLSSEGTYDPGTLAAAMAALRNSAANKEEIDEVASTLFSKPGSDVKGWKWKLSAPLNKTLLVSYTAVTAKEIKGKLWMFDER